MPRILFLLKFRDSYGCAGSALSSGLFNSARFVVDMLNHAGVQAKLVQVTDNNDIDREVYRYKPTHVVIEGLWVVPDKFYILHKLHPTVKFIVRIHSEVPFLAQEGIAMDWLAGYIRYGVQVACNSKRAQQDLQEYLSNKVLLLPNYYPRRKAKERIDSSLQVGCFGAIRPLKNQLIQALAAIVYAEKHNKELCFYITSGRCEQGGEPVLHNLRGMFKNTRHILVELPWMPHHEFLEVVDQMDLVMQVSLTESFDIVAADTVSGSIPVVVSPEITWASSYAKAKPTDMQSIISTMERALGVFKKVVSFENKRGLEKYSEDSKKIWLCSIKL